MKISSFLIVLVFFSISLKAQTFNASENPDLKIRKWSLGTSLQPIWNQNTEVGILLKRDIRKGRIRLFTSYMSKSMEQGSRKSSSSSFSNFLGYEFQTIDKKFTINYGADLILGTGQIEVSDSAFHNKTTIGQLGAKIFLGLSYRVSSRISISTEIGKALIAENHHIAISPKPAVPPLDANFTSDKFDLRQLLMLNYHF